VKEKKREKIKNTIKIGLHYKFYEPAVDGGGGLRETEDGERGGGISPSNVKKRKTVKAN
jgi:hypothetical protein